MIYIGADARSSVSAWCVIDHTDVTLAYAYDNNIATCSATSARRDQVKIYFKKFELISFFLASNAWYY